MEKEDIPMLIFVINLLVLLICVIIYETQTISINNKVLRDYEECVTINNDYYCKVEE